MPRLRGALHNHSTLSDGELSPEQVVKRYTELGFDFLAITDHDYLLRPDWRENVPTSNNGLLVFAGIELTIFERGYVHVSQIFGEHEQLHIFNHPGEYDYSLKQLIEIIEAVSHKYPLDAVEVSAKGFYTPEYDTSEIPYPKVASDDSHTSFGCGRAWVEIDCVRDRDEIIRAIKRGEAKPCFS
ncbi:MAG: PHP domain-containing protein [Candidatus Alcyoniella australis]|nr:PHP domain-containing protein [Candidatus Alcyoniella australis]